MRYNSACDVYDKHLGHIHAVHRTLNRDTLPPGAMRIIKSVYRLCKGSFIGSWREYGDRRGTRMRYNELEMGQFQQLSAVAINSLVHALFYGAVGALGDR